MALRIEGYALIGNCAGAALVGSDGSIDWLCLPRFDSPACFAALLGTPDNGRWRIAPVAPDAKVTRAYRPGTLVLETRFETATGAVVLVDAMGRRDGHGFVVRQVRCEHGHVDLRMDLAFRLDYGSVVPWVRRLDDDRLVATAGPDRFVVASDVAVRGEGAATVAEFTLHDGEAAGFSVIWSPSYREPMPASLRVDGALKRLTEDWRDWSKDFRAQAAGEWADVVERSLVTLKALTHWETGGIVAAPTTSLPESLGGPRNWDYRFCWLRDATITLRALLAYGFRCEAESWRGWLIRAIAGSPADLQIMYGVAGERRLQEYEVDWLAGYEASSPVRVGNAAADQLQLDVYGEIASAMYEARLAGLADDPVGWELGKALLAHLSEVWREPDEGMWEVRGGRRHFTVSKVLLWSAFDKAVIGAERFGRDGPVDEWRAIRDEVHRDVCAHGFDAELGHFTQFYGSTGLDAGLLLLPVVGFLPPDDPRIVATVAAVERDLVEDGLVKRYSEADGLDGLGGGREGAFLACSFWLVEARCAMGRLDEAEALFRHLVALCNDVGLLAEEYDPQAERQLGNFPQAFSHVALAIAALALVRAKAEAAR